MSVMFFNQPWRGPVQTSKKCKVDVLWLWDCVLHNEIAWLGSFDSTHAHYYTHIHTHYYTHYYYYYYNYNYYYYYTLLLLLLCFHPRVEQATGTYVYTLAGTTTVWVSPGESPAILCSTKEKILNNSSQPPIPLAYMICQSNLKLASKNTSSFLAFYAHRL